MNIAGPTQDERNGAMITYILTGVLGWLGGLIGWLIWKDKGGYARSQTTEALNFGITTLIGFVIIYIVASIIPALLFLRGILWLVQLIFGIVAALAASKGQSYRFPFALRLVK
jgi:uncharacterized Tic20 family protein